MQNNITIYRIQELIKMLGHPPVDFSDLDESALIDLLASLESVYVAQKLLQRRKKWRELKEEMLVNKPRFGI